MESIPASKIGLDKVESTGKNRPEDVRWLSSLTDSELDLLISLKLLVIQRAKIIGHEHIAQNFDLKMLRTLGFIMMKYFKKRLEDSPVVLDLSEISSLLKDYKQPELEYKDGLYSCIEDMLPLRDNVSRKRIVEGLYEAPRRGFSHQKKQRSEL